jgi:tripartite-type tricarboxylate transporter receptor subunit TctC
MRVHKHIAGAMSCLVAALAAYVSAVPAQAQSYPSRTITIVVPFPGGGTADLVPRILADGMAATLGATIVIENRPGASGTPGSATVARAAPDGYTLLSGLTPTHSINPFMQKNFPYDPLKSFEPVVLAASTALFMVVHPSLDVKTVSDLVDHARKNPGKIVFGSAGLGTGQHLMGELIRYKAKVDIVHLPYRGTGPLMTDLLSGQFLLGFATPTAVLPHVEAGKLRILAVAEPKRLDYMPNVPTIAETVPGAEFFSWYGLFAPAGTPRDLVMKINAAANKELQNPRVIAKLKEQAVDVIGGTPEDFAAVLKKDIEKWRVDLPAMGIEPQ